MKKNKGISEHEKFVKEQNEWCFLPNKQKIRYNSIILLELFQLEDFDKLIQGLDILYEELRPHQDSRLDYRKILENSKSSLFKRNTLNFPYISDLRFKGKILPDAVFYQLGDYIRHLHIKLYQILPSAVVLQIQVYIDEEASTRINDVIYSYHKEVKEPIITPKGKFTKIYGPTNLKEKEIHSLKDEIKNQAITFLSKFFRGYFFKLNEKYDSIIPSIDLFSLEYPISDKEILKWGLENSSFFQCFKTDINGYISFKYNQYLFCQDNYENFHNYLIFANRKISKSEMYSSIDANIEEPLNFCCFDLLAIDRLLEVQERLAGEFNSKISKEISDLNKNKLKNVLNNRKEIYKEIFYFERFKVEFKNYHPIPDKFSFESLGEKKSKLFDNLSNNIKRKISDISDILNIFNQNSESILRLKNIEYAKKMQDWVMCLTILIIILTLTQIFLAFRN